MAEIRVQVPDDFLRALKEKTHLKMNSEIVQEALTMLNWALSESKQGRYVVSTDVNGEDVARLVMNSLEVARASVRPRTGAISEAPRPTPRARAGLSPSPL